MMAFASKHQEPPDLFQTLPVASTHVGSIVYPPGGTYGPRIQQDYQLVLLYKGSMRVEIDGTEFNLPTGHVMLLCPGRKEMFTFSKNEETWHRWIHVTVPEERDTIGGMLRQLQFTSIPISAAMNEMFEAMLALHKSGIDFDHEAIRALAMTALSLYWHECKRTQDRDRTAHSSVVRAKAFIHDQYDRSLSLDQIAAVAGVTPEHLVRLFRKEEAATPMQYLWKYRMHHAIELLEQTGLSVAEIAERTGFKTVQHLSNMIKKHKGRCPSDIRQMKWKACKDNQRPS